MEYKADETNGRSNGHKCNFSTYCGVRRALRCIFLLVIHCIQSYLCLNSIAFERESEVDAAQLSLNIIYFFVQVITTSLWCSCGHHLSRWTNYFLECRIKGKFDVSVPIVSFTVNSHFSMLKQRHDPSRGGDLRWSLPWSEICYCKGVVAPMRMSACPQMANDYNEGDLWFTDDPQPLTIRSNWKKEILDNLFGRSLYCGKLHYFSAYFCQPQHSWQWPTSGE